MLQQLWTIDVHTHVYLPRYLQVLRARTSVPYVYHDAKTRQERLVILPEEDQDPTTKSGRPIGKEYFDLSAKLAFMDAHELQISLISLANPWVDPFPPNEQRDLATALNEDLNDVGRASGNRIYGFGVLPMEKDAAVQELHRIAELQCLRGVIMSTAGFGHGLDDPDLEVVFQTAAELNQMIFLHPHYGLGTEHFHGTGHSLALALGFPFETTTAVSRLILSGIYDRLPDLKLFLAHAGGTLPFLAGRLDSCVAHDSEVRDRLAQAPSSYLKYMYFDAIGYHAPALQCLIDVVGYERIFFGTDHPFFPPMDPTKPLWDSTLSNYAALETFPQHIQDAIRFGNAKRVFNL